MFTKILATPPDFVVVGSGPIGAFLGYLLHQMLGVSVQILDAKEDPEITSPSGGRSVNLGLSTRSLEFFDHVGITSRFDPIVAMYGREVHRLREQPETHAYSSDNRHFIRSLRRDFLAKVMVGLAREHGCVVQFNCRVSDIDLAGRAIHTVSGERIPYAMLFGADGANSIVSTTLEEPHGGPTSHAEFKVGYQEYEIPAGEQGRFQISNETYIHIWPRPNSKWFFLALPNVDGTYTGTLLGPKNEMKALGDAGDSAPISAIFKSEFPQLEPLIDINGEFAKNPVSQLYRRVPKTLHDTDHHSACVVGDAAHTMVHFLGIGTNTGIEDAIILVYLATLYQAAGRVDWPHVFETYEKRLVDLTAAADASEQNEDTLHVQIASEEYGKTRHVIQILEAQYPDLFIDPHTMYLFTHLPFSEAQFREQYQNRLIEQHELSTWHDNQDRLLEIARPVMETYQTDLAAWRREHYQTMVLSPMLDNVQAQTIKLSLLNDHQPDSICLLGILRRLPRIPIPIMLLRSLYQSYFSTPFSDHTLVVLEMAVLIRRVPNAEHDIDAVIPTVSESMQTAFDRLNLATQVIIPKAQKAWQGYEGFEETRNNAVYEEAVQMGRDALTRAAFQDMAAWYLYAAAIIDAHLPSKKDALSNAYSEAGRAYLEMGDATNNIKCQEKSLAILREIHGPDTNHADVIRTLGRLGMGYAHGGEFDQAIACHRDVVERKKRAYGENHITVAHSYNALGSALLDQGTDVAEAFRIHNEALSIRIALEGAESTEAAMSYFYIGRCHAAREEWEDARGQLTHAQTIWETSGDRYGGRVADCFFQQGLISEATGHQDQARTYFKQAWEKANQHLGRADKKTVNYHRKFMEIGG